MKRWGIFVTAFYLIVVVVLIVPGFAILAGDWSSWGQFGSRYRESFFGIYEEYWMSWVWVAVLVGGQALLLLVSVGTSWRRLKPRQHIFISAGTAAMLFGLLAFAAGWSIWAAANGDDVANDGSRNLTA